MEKLKSSKLWFFVISLLACVGLAYLDKFTLEVGGFLLALPAAYGIVDVADKREQVKLMSALIGRQREPSNNEPEEHDAFIDP